MNYDIFEGLMDTAAPQPQAAQAPQMPRPGGLAAAMPMGAGRFEQGGLVGPGGQPRIGGQSPLQSPEQMLTPENLTAEIERILTTQPQAVAQARQQVMGLLQQGMVTMEDLRVGANLARLALQDPKRYPQLRQLAIERGLLTADQLSPEYDPGYLFLLILGTEAVLRGGDQQAQAAPAPQMQPFTPQPVQAGLGAPAPQAQNPQGLPPMSMPPAAPMGSYAAGGALPARSPRADGAVPITAHEGEYVIPAHVVRAKGTEFFDAMLAKYEGGSGGGPKS